MKITVFGATGMVGKHLVNLALERDFSVRAFSRDAWANRRIHPNLEVFKGYVFQQDEVEAALAGADAVLSVLGGATDGIDKTRSLGMKTIVEAMGKTGVKRIVAVGGMGILNANDDTLIFHTEKFPAAYKPVSQEHFKAYQFLAASSLDWTMVCPPTIVDGGFTGSYETKEDFPAAGKFQINAGDLADFMLKELTGNQFVRHRVGISN